MIHWIASNRSWMIHYSRWILAACAFALVGITQLPHTMFGRLVGMAGLCAIALVFLIWLSVALITILHPRLFGRVRRKID